MNMICYNIGQMANLLAQNHQVSKVFFVGNFIRGNEIIMDFLNQAFNYYSKTELQCYFLKQDGYLGAIGCLINEVS